MSKEHFEDGMHSAEIAKPAPSEQLHYEAGADEALKVLEGTHPGGPVTPEEDRAVLRKIDIWLMPIMCTTYGLQYVDKTALSVGAIFTLVQDLNLFQVVGLTADGKPILDTGHYSNAAMIFYCGYLLGAYPLAALAQKFPIAKVCALYVFVWGVIAVLAPLCTTYAGTLVQRFFLGFVEAGVSPAFVMMTSMWYKKGEVALRTGAWYSCTGLSVVISMPISIGLLKIPTVVSGWRVLYYFWGAFTIVWAAVVYLFLPDSPVTARFLSERERYVAIERLRANQAGVENKTIKFSQIVDAATDIKVWILIFMSFLLSAPNGAVSTFTTIVLGTVNGGDKFRTAVLLMPAGAVSFVSILSSGFIASTFPNSRTFMLFFFCMPAIIGSALLWKIGLGNTSGMLAGLYLQPTFASAYVQILGFAASNVAGYTKKAVVSACVFIAYCCGNIAGPLFFKANESPLYPSGFEATVACLALGFAFAVVYRILLARENAKRDAAGPPPDHDAAFDDLTDNNNIRFRYSL